MYSWPPASTVGNYCIGLSCAGAFLKMECLPLHWHFAKQNAHLQGQYSLRVHILVCMFGLGVMMIEMMMTRKECTY